MRRGSKADLRGGVSFEPNFQVRLLNARRHPIKFMSNEADGDEHFPVRADAASAGRADGHDGGHENDRGRDDANGAHDFPACPPEMKAACMRQCRNYRTIRTHSHSNRARMRLGPLRDDGGLLAGFPPPIQSREPACDICTWNSSWQFHR